MKKLLLILPVFTILCACRYAGFEETPGKPNVVIIYSDDQGFGDVSFNQHHCPIYTPNIDRITNEGVIFSQGYVCAPTCAPSRAGLMTGRYPQRMGIYNVNDPFQALPVNEKIAPQFFKEHGYITGLIGKWHLGGEYFKEKFPIRRGFGRFYGWLDSTHDYWKANTGRSHSYGACGYAPLYDQEDPVEKMDQYLTRQLTQKALEFIDENNDKPFFLYVAHHCAHVPLHVPEETYNKYNPVGLGENTITTRAMYEELDKSIGAILDRLEKYDIRNNTFIIFQSDNGGGEPEAQLNWIYRGGKFTLLEGGLRVPTAISWPAGIPGNKIYGYPVMNIDFLPTLLAAAGIQSDKEFDGVNLLPYLRGEIKELPHEQLFWSTGRYLAVREGDWKLVFASNGQGLFNLAEDPSELTDLREKYPGKAKALKDSFNAWNRKNVKVQPTQDQLEFVRNRQMNAEEYRKNWTYSSKFGGSND